jgi:hypothetical protein
VSSRDHHEPLQLGKIRELAAAGRKAVEVAPDGTQRLIIPTTCPKCHSRALRLEGGECLGCVERQRETQARVIKQLERIPPVYRVGSLERPPSFLPLDAIRAAREWLAGSKRALSIVANEGETAAGKSTLAACALYSAAKHGASIRWVHAADLVDPDAARARDAMDAIRSGHFVGIDGLGKEFGNTRHVESYDSDKPRAIMVRVFTHIHQARGQRFVLTFDVDVAAAWGELYDAALMRRVMGEEFATTIRLERKEALRMPRLK